MKKTILLNTDFLEQVELLPMNDRGILFTALLKYQRGEEIPDMNPLTKMAYSFIRSQIDATNKAYEEKVNKCKEAGKRSAEVRWAAKEEEPKEEKPKQKKAEDDSPVLIQLTLNTGDKYPVTTKTVETWKQLYPSVDIMQELRKMEGWLDANPNKRKTAAGIKRFVNNWLSREQDKGGKPQTTATNAQKNRFHNFEERKYTADDFTNLERKLAGIHG